MKKIENLRDLFIEESQELYSSNQQQIDALPKFEKHATSVNLKKLINQEIRNTEDQQVKLKKILAGFKTPGNEAYCESTKAILKESERKIELTRGESIRDAGIISSLQQLGHRKIAGLGATSAYAKEIGHKEEASQLHTWLQDEKKLGKELIQLAQTDINRKAMSAVEA